MTFRAKRVQRSFLYRVAAPPSAVFPLLCPVREHDWIDGWRADVIASASGVAEDHCVFTTSFPARGLGVWVVSRYEPPHQIGFTIFYAGFYTERLDVTLETLDEGGSHVCWTRTYTALSDEGNAVLEQATGPQLDERMEHLQASLVHFLATGGECLRS